MPLTVADYEASMKHAIGGDPDSRIVLLNVLNDALRYLYDSHSWSFRERPILEIDTVANQSYIAMPADFGELISCHFDTREVSLTSLSDIAHRRATTLIPPPMAAVYVAISWPAQSNNTSSQPTPLLEIFPTPTGTDPYTIVYRGGPIQLVNTTDVPNIPPNYERLLTLISRAFVLDLEEQDTATEWAKANEEMAKLQQHDAMTQQNVGKILGGAVNDRRRRVNFWLSGLTPR